MLPRATLIWLNYNSLKIKDIIKRSLNALSKINYKNLQIIIVDNGSTDGSYELIENYINKINLKADLIRNKRNLGFGEGINRGYRERDKRSEYVFIINNDAIPLPDSIKKMVKFMKSRRDVGSVQAIIMHLFRKNFVDSAGVFVDELVRTIAIHKLIRKPLEISYADGAYCGYKVEVLEKLGLIDRMFPKEAFVYLNDYLLGFKIWNTGYKIFSLPFISAYHGRSMTFGKINPRKAYYSLRDWLTSLFLSNSKKKKFWPFVIMRTLISWSIRGYINPILLRKAIKDAKKLARKMSFWRYNIYKVPHTKLFAGTFTISLLYKGILEKLLYKKENIH